MKRQKFSPYFYISLFMLIFFITMFFIFLGVKNYKLSILFTIFIGITIIALTLLFPQKIIETEQIIQETKSAQTEKTVDSFDEKFKEDTNKNIEINNIFDSQQQKSNDIVANTNSPIKIIFIALGVGALIGLIIFVIILSIPKDYEYELLQYEVMNYDNSKAIISIEITNNTNTRKYCYVIVKVYSQDGLLITWGEAVFTPPPKSTDIYQMTVQSYNDSLLGSSVQISSFTPLDL